MGQSVFVLGGTGQIGRACARRFLEAGWSVALAGRDPAHMPADLAHAGVRFARVDRSEPGAVAAAVGEGVDVLVDVVAYTEEDAEQVRSLADSLGSVVAISSASVYADDAGRTLDESKESGFPQLPVPILESQRTVEPGAQTYSTQKVAMEGALLEDVRLRATIVRPCAIHGPGSALAREWFFVKRALDRRRPLLLAYRGASRFHTTSVENLAELIWLAAVRPGRRIVNCGDPNPPTVLEIARTVAELMDHEFVEVLLPGAAEGGVGRNPWATPRPFVIDMLTAELGLRYRPVTTYARAVRATVEWLVEARPQPGEYMATMFDYAAEDSFLANLAG